MGFGLLSAGSLRKGSSGDLLAEEITAATISGKIEKANKLNPGSTVVERAGFKIDKLCLIPTGNIIAVLKLNSRNNMAITDIERPNGFIFTIHFHNILFRLFPRLV